ncbi:ABC-F family ATP-binding cassette domain-containing protein [candidate division WWE3 bacterium]|nr:ABC-F family ATP-binding cassette domain-containing protein [candidate division WWE3 bacterium]
MITAKNLTKAYGDQEIITNVNFKIGGSKKIGLVGKNGCGKSTLFKVLNGIEDASAGNLEIQGEVFGYIPQEFSFPDELVGEYLEKQLDSVWDFYKIEAFASKLRFNNFDPYQKINSMSEGQKMRIKLIEALLKDPTTLFIDEPTNHLDIEGIMWFESYVKHLDKNIVMISHDRSFLNHTVDEIWEIDKKQIFRFVGDYDFYKEEKLKLINKWDQEYVLFLKKKAQLETLLENVRKIKDGKKRGSAVESVKKRIVREIEENKKEKYESKKVKDIEFKSEVHLSKLMLRFDGVSKSYGEKEIFKDLNFELRGKEKVWLYGPNGAGKSTIVKIVMGLEKPTLGNVTLGNNINIGYFSQVQSNLVSENTLLEEFIEKTGIYFGKAFGYLSKFLFDKDSVQKKIWQLSPGERARFAFAIFAYKDYDLLILDEPDNHLDIETKEVIEKSLSEFNGTLLLVSHDRYFVEMVGVDKVLNLSDGGIKSFERF